MARIGELELAEDPFYRASVLKIIECLICNCTGVEHGTMSETFSSRWPCYHYRIQKMYTIINYEPKLIVLLLQILLLYRM